MQTKLYTACVKPLENEQIFEQLYAQASEERKEKISRMRFGNTRMLSLGAEALLLHALRENGYSPEKLVYAYGEYGKPALPDKEGFFFNFSHSGEFVIVAVSDREIGCDIERIKPVKLKLAKYAFTPQEYEMILLSDEDMRDDLFCRFWTLKESYMKAVGKGLSLHPSTFQVVLDEPVHVIAEGSRPDYSFREWDDIPGYRYCICLEGDLPSIQKETVDFSQIAGGYV